jgi:outer membrane protein TolC
MLMVLVVLMLITAELSRGQMTLTIEDARRMALEFNRGYLSAREEVRIAQSEIVKARAGALPSIHLDGHYTRNIRIPSFFVSDGDTTVEFETGFKNNFGATLSLEQPIWQGGKVFTAYAVARLYKEYAEAASSQTKADVVYNVDILFHRTVLERARLAVYRKAYEANKLNYEVVEKLHSQGQVSRFELLRARVERNNLLPQIIEAESAVQLAEKRLKSFIGVDLNSEVTVIPERADTSLTGLPTLAELTETALRERPEVQRANLLVEISNKAVRIARGGYYPSFSAITRYDWQTASNRWTLDENTSESWTAGITVSFPIFEGWATRGEVTMRKAENSQARLAAKQVLDDVKLEVEAAHDQLLQAKRSLDVQGATIAHAEEGLKIANLRYQSGMGTQLEVLSAQAALTEARRAEAEALFHFRRAKAGIKKATTLDLHADTDL